MRKYLFNTVEEHWVWAWDYLRFKAHKDHHVSGETGLRYAELMDCRRIAERFDPPELCELLGFTYDADGEKDDMFSDFELDKPTEKRSDIAYPCVLATWMELGYDRNSGENMVICNAFINMSDFKKV